MAGRRAMQNTRESCTTRTWRLMRILPKAVTLGSWLAIVYYSGICEDISSMGADLGDVGRLVGCIALKFYASLLISCVMGRCLWSITIPDCQYIAEEDRVGPCQPCLFAESTDNAALLSLYRTFV
jgi:hypothetical protein